MGRLFHQPVKFRRGGLIKAGFINTVQDANRLKYAQCSKRVRIGGIFRGLKGYHHVALSRQVIDFIGLNFLDDANQIGGIGQVTVMHEKAYVCLMRIFI